MREELYSLAPNGDIICHSRTKGSKNGYIKGKLVDASKVAKGKIDAAGKYVYDTGNKIKDTASLTKAKINTAIPNLKANAKVASKVPSSQLNYAKYKYHDIAIINNKAKSLKQQYKDRQNYNKKLSKSPLYGWTSQGAKEDINLLLGINKYSKKASEHRKKRDIAAKKVNKIYYSAVKDLKNGAKETKAAKKNYNKLLKEYTKKYSKK